MSLRDFLYDGTPGFGRTRDVAEPDLLRAGDSLAWVARWRNYPASAGWVLSYVINSPTARFLIAPEDITPDPDGNSFDISIPSAETATWTAGAYQWIASITLGTQRQTAGLGQMIVQPNLIDATGPIDTRSAAEINLAATEAALASRAIGGIESYMIAGRETKYMPLSELMRLRSYYKGLVRQERLDRGELPASTKVVVEFGPTWR